MCGWGGGRVGVNGCMHVCVHIHVCLQHHVVGGVLNTIYNCI